MDKSLNNNLSITSDINYISDSNIYIITVPTPIDSLNKPDLSPLINASISVGKIITKGNIVIYESTVYPGCTEEVCVPILEKHSGLIYNHDFFCGYSPERINPGDKKHTVDKIIKVTSGSTNEAAKIIDKLYSSVIKAGTHRASSIKVAEAAKVIENSQRDINIAFINELAKIFSKLDIDTHEVLDAASTKWNFLNFKPGLVGGHCIGIDPYYLAEKSLLAGHNPEIILAGRKVNDSMADFIAEEFISLIKENHKSVDGLNVLVMGVTFKENCTDFRNTKVIDLVKKVQEYQISIDLYDPLVNKESFNQEFDTPVYNELPKLKYDGIILAVSHEVFKKIDLAELKKNEKSVVYDIKGFFDRGKITKRL